VIVLPTGHSEPALQACRRASRHPRIRRSIRSLAAYDRRVRDDGAQIVVPDAAHQGAAAPPRKVAMTLPRDPHRRDVGETRDVGDLLRAAVSKSASAGAAQGIDAEMALYAENAPRDRHEAVHHRHYDDQGSAPPRGEFEQRETAMTRRTPLPSRPQLSERPPPPPPKHR